MTKRYYKKNAWWLSPFNDIPEVYKETQLSGAVELQDMTLHDWGASVDADYTLQEARQIIELLQVAGVGRMDLALPTESGPSPDEIRQLCADDGGVRFYAPVQSSKSAIAAAAACGMTGVVISVPLGYPKLRYQLGWAWENALEAAVELMSHAKAKGLEVILAPEDLARARPEDFESFARAAAKTGLADVWRIDDSIGGALPQAVQYLVRRSKKLLKIPVQVCVSNSFGMALASTLGALTAGAQTACVSVNGLRRCCGCAATEEVITCLCMMLGCAKQFRMDRLFELSLLVEQASGVEIPPAKPIGGDKNYTVSGAAFESASHHPIYTFGCAPRLFGRDVQAAHGKA